MKQKTTTEIENGTPSAEADDRFEALVYVFSSTEIARLRLYRAAVTVGFYTDELGSARR
jgi:hypothetical protein